jgi:hypothetical protein
MEALEGRRDEAGTGNDNMIEDQDDAVERWIEEIRKDLEKGDRDTSHKLEGLRSEAMFRRVLQKIGDRRSPESWMQRLRRMVRAIASIGPAIWISRAARTLMP